jgi:hypothetical protein
MNEVINEHDREILTQILDLLNARKEDNDN